MSKKRSVEDRGPRPSEKRSLTIEELKWVMGGEVGSGGDGTVNDPPGMDNKPPG